MTSWYNLNSQGSSVLVVTQVYFTQMVSNISFFYTFLASEMCGLYWQGRSKELHDENKRMSKKCPLNFWFEFKISRFHFSHELKRGVWLVEISIAIPAVLYSSSILPSWFPPQGPIWNCFRDLSSSLSPPKCLSPSFIRVPATEILSSKHMLFLFQNWPLLGHVWEVNISQLLEQMRQCYCRAIYLGVKTWTISPCFLLMCTCPAAQRFF